MASTQSVAHTARQDMLLYQYLAGTLLIGWALCRRVYQPPGGQLQGGCHQAALASSKYSNLEDQLAPYEGVANLLSESEGSQERDASRQQQLAAPRPEKRSRGSRRVHFTDEEAAQVVCLPPVPLNNVPIWVLDLSLNVCSCWPGASRQTCDIPCVPLLPQSVIGRLSGIEFRAVQPEAEAFRSQSVIEVESSD